MKREGHVNLREGDWGTGSDKRERVDERMRTRGQISEEARERDRERVIEKLKRVRASEKVGLFLHNSSLLSLLFTRS